MDGNRRYAVKNHQDKHTGHSAGLKKLEQALIWCKGLGIQELTVFALAKDNLKRSKVEVDTLMGLCKDQFSRLARNNGLFQQQQIRIRILGDLSLIPNDVAEALHKTEELTRHHKETVLNVCICYSSKDEIKEALAAKPKTVGEFEALLCGGYNIKPDIVVRTSGEIRLSNFMLYQT
jgi:ditrans,polycis-polyprenyl diphosphate synthase